MAKLVCQTGPKAGHEYPLTKDVTIMGRQSSCDVQILDNMSSRAHCQIRRDGKLFSLVDLGSRNGTYLNDKKVSERQLAFGDRIRVGEAEYKLVKEPGDVELKDLLSKYEVMEKIGEGGMGIVYKATQKSMGRVVALKILSPKYSSKQRFVDQFIKEARAAGALNHPNIIQVHEVGTENDIHYFSMEYVEGATCMQALREQGPFKVGEALEIIRQTAKALEYAHSQRLIHQDIKPDNIMIGPNNQVKLADLGISKTFDEVESEEGPKRVMGTPHYMAPEAALGKKIDHRVDIYALGATLYHLLTGKTPFNGTSATEVLKAHVMDPLPPIEDINPDVPSDVCALVERLVAKKPEDRYQTAAEIVAEVVRLQAGHGLGTARISGGETMLLRRYVGGDKAAHQTPAGTTNTRTPRANDLGVTTAERVIRRGNNNSGVIKGVVFSVIVLILVIIGWNVLNSRTIAIRPGPNPPSSNQPETKPNPEQPVEDPNVKRHASALTSLEQELNSGNADLSRLLKQIDELREQKLSSENLTRAKMLHDKIGALIRERQNKAIEQDFAELKTATQKFSSGYDFAAALNRIDAFPHKDHATVASRVTALRDDITKTRDNYLANLRQKVQTAASQKNLTRLKELRDQLPEPLLGTDAENTIAAAIKVIEDQRLAEQAVIVQGAATALAKWDFATVEEIARTNRAAMGQTANGQLLDSYIDATSRLKAMVAALNAQLQKDGKRRYRGTLKGWLDPDLLAGDATTVQIQIATGGTASMKWSEIPPDALQAIVSLILTKDQADAAQIGLDTWIATKGDSAK